MANIKNITYFKQRKYDIIILAVSHKIFLKKLDFYDKFFKSKQKKIFIDLKNNYDFDELKKKDFSYFQL